MPTSSRFEYDPTTGSVSPIDEERLDWKRLSRAAVEGVSGGEGFLIPLFGPPPSFAGSIPLRDPAPWTVPLAKFTEKPLRTYWFNAHRHRRFKDRRVCLWGVLDGGTVMTGVSILVDRPTLERYQRMFPSIPVVSA